jgi:hypothetical protein
LRWYGNSRHFNGRAEVALCGHDQPLRKVGAGDTAPPCYDCRHKSNLRLVDGAELVDLIFHHYDQFDPRYKGVLPLKRVYVPEVIEGAEEWEWHAGNRARRRT